MSLKFSVKMIDAKTVEFKTLTSEDVYLLVALTAGPMTEYLGLAVTAPGTTLSGSVTHYCNYLENIQYR